MATASNSKFKGNMSKLEEIAKSKNLPIVDTVQVIRLLENDILLDLYRLDPTGPQWSKEEKTFNLDLNAKIRAVYKEMYNTEFTEDLLIHKNAPFCLNGAPGQGKTTAYEVAARNIAKRLSLNFVRDVTENHVPSLNDFLFVVQDSAGKTSVLEYALPRAVAVKERGVNGEEEENYYLKSALNWRFMCLNKSAGGILLFDDAPNASINVQNSFLQVAINKSFGGMKLRNAHIGFTGNMGAADGTYTNDFGSALRNRTVNVFVRDTVENFTLRGHMKFQTDCYDMGLLNYLQRNPDDLSSLPEQGSAAGFNSPRSWDDFVAKMIITLKRHGGKGVGEEACMDDLRIFAPSMLGDVVGAKVIAYYNSLLLGADPIAKEAITTGNLPEEKFTEKYGNGGTEDAVTFGYQYANACADYTTNMIRLKVDEFEKDNKNSTDEEFDLVIEGVLKEACLRFGKATERLLENEFSYGLNHLMSKIASSIPRMGRMSNDGPRLERTYPRIMSKVLCNMPDISPERQDLIIGTLSQSNKHRKEVMREDIGYASEAQEKTRSRTRTRS